MSDLNALLAAANKASGSVNVKLRRKARLSAVQALYQMETTGLGVIAAIREFQDHRFGHKDETGYTEVDEAFFTELLNGTVENQSVIDPAIISKLSEKWKLSRLDKTLRAIMRCGAYEIMFCPDIPAIVIIDEYVSLTSHFFDDKETRFVNAALENLAKEKRANEFKSAK